VFLLEMDGKDSETKQENAKKACLYH